jgi:hypothetical protein
MSQALSELLAEETCNVLPPTMDETHFVTTIWGSSPLLLESRDIPKSPREFITKGSKPLPMPVLPASLPCRQPCCARPLVSAPQHSARLAKKARNRAPALIATQNILMRKLGLCTMEPVESADFDCYLDLFKDGLSKA